MCDIKIPVGLKGRVYQMVVKPNLLYRSKTWLIKKTQVQRLNGCKYEDITVDTWSCEIG